MRRYLVTWEMEISADDPTQAARLALEIHRDPESLATVFDVLDMRDRSRTRVDLLGETAKELP